MNKNPNDNNDPKYSYHKGKSLDVVDKSHEQTKSVKDISETEKKNNKQKKTRKKSLFILAIVTILSVGGYYIYNKMNSFKEFTDNAYVKGNIINITSEVSGTVNNVYVHNTNFVSAGQTLVKLDDDDAKINLIKAKAKLADVVRSIRQEYDDVDIKKQYLKQSRINLLKAKRDYNRRKYLIKKHLISKEEFEHNRSNFESAKIKLKLALKSYKIAKDLVSGITLANNPEVLSAKAFFIEAWLNLQRNKIYSPVKGVVAQRDVQVGKKIVPGVPLLSVIPINNLWINANFKESQLENIRPGESAEITFDLYGTKVIFHGRVVGISAGTGSAFALLPAQNASGNWVKVIQRVPVRIMLNEQELKKHPLRIGLSAKVTIDTNPSHITFSKYQASSIHKILIKPYSVRSAEKIANNIIKINSK